MFTKYQPMYSFLHLLLQYILISFCLRCSLEKTKNPELINKFKIVFDKLMIQGIEDKATIKNENRFNELFDTASAAAMQQL